MPGSTPSSSSAHGTPKRRPSKRPAVGSSIASRGPVQVASLGESAEITWCRSAASRTVSVIGPTCSSEHAKAITPKRETVP